MERDARNPLSRRPIAVEKDQRGDEGHYPISVWSKRGEWISESEKAEALHDSLRTKFQPVTDPSVPTVIDV